MAPPLVQCIAASNSPVSMFVVQASVFALSTVASMPISEKLSLRISSVGDVVRPARRVGHGELDRLAGLVEQRVAVELVARVGQHLLRALDVDLVLAAFISSEMNGSPAGVGMPVDARDLRVEVARLALVEDVLAVDDHAHRAAQGRVVERLLLGVEEQAVDGEHRREPQLVVLGILVDVDRLVVRDERERPLRRAVRERGGLRVVVVVRRVAQLLGLRQVLPVLVAPRQRDGLRGERLQLVRDPCRPASSRCRSPGPERRPLVLGHHRPWSGCRPGSRTAAT